MNAISGFLEIYPSLVWELDCAIKAYQKKDAPKLIINDLEEIRKNITKAYGLLINEAE